MKKLNRRTLLRGGFGVAIALPWLEAMSAPRPASAQGTAGLTPSGFPKRFLVYFTPNGTINGNWLPRGTQNSWELSRILLPLAPFKSKLTFAAGFGQSGEGGDDHQNGMQGMLTSQRLNSGPWDGSGFSSGISVDQRMANVLGSKTKFPSLELAAQPGNGISKGGETNWNRMIHKGSNQPIPPEEDPHKVFDRLFSDLSVDPADREKLTSRKRSVLDAVIEDYTSLQGRLGSSDRSKIEAHVTSLREIELRLGAQAAGGGCVAPSIGPAFDYKANAQFPQTQQLLVDLMGMAVACDLTRIASLQNNESVGQVVFNWVDSSITKGHHVLSHEDGPQAEALTKINIWYAERLASLLQRLDSIPEGSGTLLDNTIVYWCNELSSGGGHLRENMGYLIAGSAGGALRHGQFLDKGEDVNHPHADLLLTFLHAMGIPDASFGVPDWCRGTIPQLLA
jgi:hypothetical protein